MPMDLNSLSRDEGTGAKADEIGAGRRKLRSRRKRSMRRRSRSRLRCIVLIDTQFKGTPCYMNNIDDAR